MYRRSKETNTGFTLVELMLAMSFIAILLVSIAMLSIYLTTLYDRGSTLKDINQAGTEITSDIKRSIAAAPDGSPVLRAPYYMGGAPQNRLYILCTGSVSYIMNSGHSLDATNPNPPTWGPAKYNGTTTPIRLAKVENDSTNRLCTQPINSLFIGPQRRLSPSFTARELLSQETSHTLSVWELRASFYPLAGSPELTTVALTVGTSESLDIDFISGPYPTCNTGNGSEWCGINTFEIVGRSGNGSEV